MLAGPRQRASMTSSRSAGMDAGSAPPARATNSRPAARTTRRVMRSLGEVDEDLASHLVSGPDGHRPDLHLAFLIGAAGVADGDLVDAPRGAAAAGDLGGDLRLEAEAVRLEVDALEHLTPEDLVTGLHIGQVQVSEHVRHKGEELIADVVP